MIKWDDNTTDNKMLEALLSSAPATEKLDPAKRAAIWEALDEHLTDAPERKPARRWRFAMPALAAAVLFIMCGIVLYSMQSGEQLGSFVTASGTRSISPGETLSTGVNDTARLQFADGSKLFVCAGTELTVMGPRGPKPVLRLAKGELRADIARDPGRPFLIDTPEARLRVLGTKFSCRVLPSISFTEDINMKALRDTLHKAMLIVSVFSGSVAVSTGATEQVVNTGQRVVVAANTASTENMANTDFTRDIAERTATPNAEAAVFQPIRQNLMSSLWAVDIATGQPRHITDFIGWPRPMAQFPTGLAFVEVNGVIFSHKGNGPISGSGRPIVNDRIVLVDLVTGRKLPMTPLNDYRPIYIDLSPDCRKLAFVGMTRMDDDEDWSKADSGIYIMDLETFKVDRLLKGNLKTCPHWSPDSRWLAVSRGEDYNTSHAITLIDTATRNVMNTNLQGVGITFSPDGKTMAYTAGFKRSGGWMAGVPSSGNLFIADFPSGTARQLTNLPNGGAIFPAYSPDGSRIAWWEAAGTSSKLHVIDAATGDDQYVTDGNPFGQTRWLDAHKRLYLSDVKKEKQFVKLVDLSGGTPKVTEIAPDLPKESTAVLGEQKAQADELYKVFVVYAEAIKAQDLHQFESAQARFAEARDMMKKISDASDASKNGAGPQDLAPYVETFAKEAARNPAERTERIVRDNLKQYISTIIGEYYDKYHTLPTAQKSDDPAVPTFDEVAMGKAGLRFQINHIKSSDTQRVRRVFVIPGEDSDKVATSYKVVKRDPKAGVMVLETPPLAGGKRLQATYTLTKQGNYSYFKGEVKTID